MAYKKSRRRDFWDTEWRLASTNELEPITKTSVLGPWDTVRLLDGWVSGSGFNYECEQGYKSDIEEMLLVNVSEPSEIYSGVELSEEGTEAALSLFWEDKITHVVLVVLNSIVNRFETVERRQAALDSLMESMTKKFPNKRPLMHYAADQRVNKQLAKDIAEVLVDKFERGKEIVKAKDKNRRTALHFAALNGNIDLCEFLISRCQMRVDEKDEKGENLLHYAVIGPFTRTLFQKLCELSGVEEIIASQDVQGKTVLHKAAAKGRNAKIEDLLSKVTDDERKQKLIRQADLSGRTALHEATRGGRERVVEILLNKLREDEERKMLICQADLSGRTALHEATRGGHERIVEFLLSKLTEDDEKKALTCQADLFGATALHEATRGGHESVVKILLTNGASPLVERDPDGKTALHYAVQLPDEKAKAIAKLLLDKCQSDEERSLLLWASAVGIGTAEESSKSSHNDTVKKYLADERKKTRASSDNLLKSAIRVSHYNMAWELVNRGASPDALSTFSDTGSVEGKRAQNFRDKIKKMPERGRDQPTIEDGLGRQHFVKGLTALFLNPYVKTPVTVGILGHWGMGKSSFMLQTEILLLQTASQLAFPNLLEREDFPGNVEFVLSKNGQRKYEKIKEGVKHFKIEDSTNRDENPLVSFLDKYQEKYHRVYRSLALMDRKDMFDVKDGISDSTSNQQSVGNIPTILPVRYNAWQYQDEQEAWAGLAVEIPKAIEEAMTSAQRIRCRWRYAWEQHRNEIYMELFLPCLLALFLSFWVAWALWILISRCKNKGLVELTYGSIPITILLVVWTVVKQVLSVVKPLSAQIRGYVRKQDHSVNLGYQHQVISDINFSRKELGEKPSFLWKFIAWLWSFCGLFPDTIEGTSIPKSPPPGKDDIRIIVFVDDLDRCDDEVILKVLSAVSLVLAVCEINVILGMDEKMVRRAIRNKFKGEKDAKDLALKYIDKIVQLPLALPDSNKDEMKGFLKQQLGPELESDEDLYSNVAESNQTSASADYNEADVTLDISCTTPDSCTDFSSRTSQLNEPLLVNRMPYRQGKKLTTPLKSMQLLPNYSREERKALTSLSEVRENSERLPREWKGFLTYHRVAWNILQDSAQVRNCPGWQVQLIVWLFCCWQWKDQINIIIKNWEKLISINDVGRNHDEPSLPNMDECSSPDFKTHSINEDEEEDDVGDEEDSSLSRKLSLGNIVQRHLELEAEKPAKVEQQMEAEKQTEAKAEPEEPKAEPEMEAEKQTKGYGKGKEEQGRTKVKDEQKEHTGEVKTKGLGIAKGNEKQDEKKWREMKDILIKYDVSMDCIQRFQKFRLRCKIKNLPEPPSGSSAE